MHEDLKEVLLSEDDIQEICRDLGAKLTADYQGKPLVCIGILKGSVMFMADLIKRIDTHLAIDFMDVSSYGDAFESSGEVKIIKDLDTHLEGRHVLVVEDIIDTGRTLKYLVDLFKYRKAASVQVCTLLDKPVRRVVKDIIPDYVGLEVPDEFVVGYGLDFEQKYRNLPYIGVLKPEIYQ